MACNDQSHPNCHHHSRAFIALEEAENYLSRLCTPILYKTLTDKIVCKMYNRKNVKCTANGRIKKAHRMGSDGQIHKIHLVLACKFHVGHSEEIPVHGFCSKSHNHELFNETLSTIEAAKQRAKEVLENKFKIKVRNSQHQDVYSCNVKDCPASISLFRKKEDQVRLQGRDLRMLI